MNTTSISQRKAFNRKKHRGLRILIRVLLIVILLASLATLAVSYDVGKKLSHPARIPVTRTPSQVGLTYKTVQFPARTDHVKLHGWLIPAAKHIDKIVITAHGYHENRSSESAMLPMVKALHDAGFAVLMFDFRDEGNSLGRIVSVGFYENRDLKGAVDYARSLGYRHIGLYGLSMGASTALETISETPDVQAAVADSPFANLHSYLLENMPYWTRLPNWPFTPEILWEMRLFYGINTNKVNPLTDLSHMRPRPLMLIAGTADKTIPMSNSKALYREVKQNKFDTLWIVKGAKHIGAYAVNPSVYERKVTGFFKMYL